MLLPIDDAILNGAEPRKLLINFINSFYEFLNYLRFIISIDKYITIIMRERWLGEYVVIISEARACR